MRSVLPALLVLLVLSARASAQVVECGRPAEGRSYADGVFTSASLPPLRMRVGPPWRYLGAHPTRIRDLAGGERHVFVQTEGDEASRLLILQFEGYLPGIPHRYNYRMTNPVRLGGETYNHNTFFYGVAASARGNPGAEVDSTRAFLRRHRLRWPDGQMTSRFVRTVDPDRRHELIIFYSESIAAAGYALEQIAVDGGIRPEFAAVAEALTRRSLESFAVLPPCPR
jgi:hypothetical protein